MLSLFSKINELRAKRAIHRGVYEDNLRIIGKNPYPNSWKTSLFLRKMFLFLTVTLLILLGHGNYLNLTLFPEKQITASLIAQKSYNADYGNNPSSQLSIKGQGEVNPSEYKAFLGSNNMPISRMFGLEVKTIMIDPGHGGDDPGTIGKMGTKEKDITLDIAKRLREKLKKYGNYNVILTREQDATLPLVQRVESARSNRTDLFISIHLNYLPYKPINIIETYYFGSPSDNKTLKLAEQENAGSQYGLSDFKEIIEKIGETLKFQESKEFAASIQKNLFMNTQKENGNIRDFGVKRAPFVVLLGVDVPAVLTEVSCLSNKKEEVELNTETHRENIAKYLEAGILDYLNKGETRHEAKRN